MFELDSNNNLQKSGAKSREIPGAFVGKSGSLYVRVRRLQATETGELYHQQTAVYPSIEAYNTRSSRPEYKLLTEIIDDYQTPVTIDLETLTIHPNDIL